MTMLFHAFVILKYLESVREVLNKYFKILKVFKLAY